MTSLHRIQFPVHAEKLSVEYIKFFANNIYCNANYEI